MNSGQSPHSGPRAVQTRAPSSITATAQVAAVRSAAGSSAVAVRRSAAVVAWAGYSAPDTARANTRRTLVSSTTCRWPKAKEATAAAVYSPTPGSESRVAWSSGTSPPCFSVIATAAPCRRNARRG